MPEWLDTMVYTAMPNALWLIYAWAKEWQTLIAGLLVIAAARYFSRASTRSARTLAEAIIRSARISAAASQAANRQPGALPEQQASGSLQPALSSASESAATSASAPPSRPFAPGKYDARAELGASLQALRNAIRSALAVIPPTHSNIGEKGVELYGRVVSIAFPEIDPASVDADVIDLFQRLKAEIAALSQHSGETVHAHQVWEELARVNRLARELQTKLLSAGAMNITVVKETG